MITVISTLFASDPPFPSETVQVIVYVPAASGAVQVTEEPDPETVPLTVAHAYVRGVSPSASEAVQAMAETAPVDTRVGVAVSDDIVGALLGGVGVGVGVDVGVIAVLVSCKASFLSFTSSTLCFTAAIIPKCSSSALRGGAHKTTDRHISMHNRLGVKNNLIFGFDCRKIFIFALPRQHLPKKLNQKNSSFKKKQNYQEMIGK